MQRLYGNVKVADVLFEVYGQADSFLAGIGFLNPIG